MTFETVSIGDVADVTKLAGFEFTKYIEYNETGEIIALRALNLRNGTLDLTDIKRIDRSVSEKLPRSKLYINDILLTYTGNGYGDCAIVEENDKYHLAPNICKIAPNSERINPYFLYSVIRSSYFYQQMKNYIGGSSQPTIPMKTIRVLQVPYPPIQTQNQIASILNGINSKIVINTAINENLEQQAQAIFKSWFGADIENLNPSNCKSLGELVTSVDNRGKTPPLSNEKTEYPIIDVRALSGSGRIINFSNCTKYVEEETYNNWFRNGHPKDYDILISTVGSLAEMKIYLGNIGCIAQNVVGFRSKGLSPIYLYQYLNYIRKELVSYNIGSVQPSIKVTHIIKHPIFIPENDKIEKFDMLIKDYTLKIYNNCCENKRLVELRDTLLPKLMNGEIDISKVKT